MVMMTVLSIILLAASALIVFLVLSQDTKGGGLAGALGGGTMQTALGGRSAESVTKFTAWVAVFFFVLIVAMDIWGSHSTLGLSDKPGTEKAPLPAPTSTNK